MKQDGEFYIKVQCTVPETGSIATFLSQYENGKDHSVSPTFPSLAELYPWMKRNGYVSDEYDQVGERQVFRPWRAGRVTCPNWPCQLPKDHKGRCSSSDEVQ